MQGRTTKHILLSLTLISWLLKLWHLPKSCKKSIWAEKTVFLKIVLKRVLTLPRARSRQMRQFPLKAMGLQNKNKSVVTKHWKDRILVPMSILMLGHGVGRQARGVGRQGGSLDLSFSLYFLVGRASRPRPTRNKQTNNKQQTRLPSRTPYPIAPRDQNTPLGTPSLWQKG